MHTPATWDHQNPAIFRAASRKDLERYGTVTVENKEVTRVQKVEDGLFKESTDGDKSWTARKIILATGVVDVFPETEGYVECWIKGM